MASARGHGVDAAVGRGQALPEGTGRLKVARWAKTEQAPLIPVILIPAPLPGLMLELKRIWDGVSLDAPPPKGTGRSTGAGGRPVKRPGPFGAVSTRADDAVRLHEGPEAPSRKPPDARFK